MVGRCLDRVVVEQRAGVGQRDDGDVVEFAERFEAGGALADDVGVGFLAAQVVGTRQRAVATAGQALVGGLQADHQRRRRERIRTRQPVEVDHRVLVFGVVEL